jgi:hypothetical protein
MTMSLRSTPYLSRVNRTAITLLSCLGFLGLGPAQAQVSSNLAAHYRFDEGAGRTILDSSGNANNANLDFPGIVRTAAWGSYPRWTQGGVGQALAFDGLDDRIIVPSSPSLQLQTFTVALWVKVGRAANVYVTQELRQRGHTAPATLLRRGWMPGGVNYDLQFNRVTGVVSAVSTLGGTEHTLSANAHLLDGNWHHLVYSYDGTAQRLYVDGALQSSTMIGATAATGAIQLEMGIGLHGLMDEVRVYSRALTNSEVTQLFASPKPAFAPPAFPPMPAYTVPALSDRFKSGSRVKVKHLVAVRDGGTLNFRDAPSKEAWAAKYGVALADGPSVNNKHLGAQPQGAVGKVVGGPLIDAIRGPFSTVQWWKVKFRTGVDGWVPDDFLIHETDPLPAPHSPGVPPIPGFERWENHMLAFGQYHCRQANYQGIWDGGSVWFYDGQRMFYQIADYMRLPFFNACAEMIGDSYQDYVFDRVGQDYPYRTFTGGLRMDYERTGDPRAAEAVFYLGTNAFGSHDAYSMVGADRQRENSYTMEHILDLEALGLLSRPTKLEQTLENSLGHLNQVFVQKSYRIKSFMVGLQAEALIQYYNEKAKDPRILPALKTAADVLWTENWVDSAGAFRYCSLAPAAGDSDCHGRAYSGLNLLIAHLYGWLYQQTGDASYRDKGDRIFTQGVARAMSKDPGNAYLVYGKQFTQNYRLSIAYVQKYRGAGPAPHSNRSNRQSTFEGARPCNYPSLAAFRSKRPSSVVWHVPARDTPSSLSATGGACYEAAALGAEPRRYSRGRPSF